MVATTRANGTSSCFKFRTHALPRHKLQLQKQQYVRCSLVTSTRQLQSLQQRASLFSAQQATDSSTHIDTLSQQLHITHWHDWYNLPKQRIRNNLVGHDLLHLHQQSLYSLLQSSYPYHPWISLKFHDVSLNEIEQLQNQRQLLECVGDAVGLRESREWYSVTREQIQTHGGGRLLTYYHQSLGTMMQAIFPEHRWLPWMFSDLPKRFLSQQTTSSTPGNLGNANNSSNELDVNTQTNIITSTTATTTAVTTNIKSDSTNKSKIQSNRSQHAKPSTAVAPIPAAPPALLEKFRLVDEDPSAIFINIRKYQDFMEPVNQYATRQSPFFFRCHITLPFFSSRFFFCCCCLAF